MAARNPEQESYKELARRLAAAYTSWHQGVTVTTGYKNTGEDVGPFWYDLAEFTANTVAREMNQNLEAIIPGTPEAIN